MLSPHDILLLSLALASVVAIIVMIANLKVHPFPALVIGALALALLSGVGVEQALKSFKTGFGDVLANVGVVLALGAMFGGLLANSRGAERIASALMSIGGPKFAPWAMAFVAMILGLPLFFETGVVMMMPIIITVGAQLEAAARRDGVSRGSPFLLAGLPAFAGLSVLHGLVPPHPGPLVAIDALHADLGQTLLLGLIIAIPTVIVSGPLFTMWAARNATAQPPEDLVAELTRVDETFPAPSATTTVLTILFPIALMMAKAVADIALPKGAPLRDAMEFIGAPIVALLLGLILAMFTFGLGVGRNANQIGKLIADALPPTAAIMLVIGAGGAFKQTLIDVGLGDTIARASGALHMTPLLLGWLTAVFVRLATGSATVATVTAAGLLSATAAATPGLNPGLMALSIGAGSLFFSHVNDAGFWIVKSYLGVSLKDMFKTWSVMETIISVMGLGLVLLLSLVI